MLVSHLQFRQSMLSRARIINCNNSNEIDNVANTSITFCKVSIRMVVVSYLPKSIRKLLKRWNGDNIHGCIYCHQWHRKREIERTLILSKYPRNTHNFWASPNVPLTPFIINKHINECPSNPTLTRTVSTTDWYTGTKADHIKASIWNQNQLTKISGYNALTR